MGQQRADKRSVAAKSYAIKRHLANLRGTAKGEGPSVLPQSVSTSSTAAARGQDLAAFGRQQHRKSLSDKRQKEQRGWGAPSRAKAQGGKGGEETRSFQC